MNPINQTLYIPLYGKALVSKKEIILNDPKAIEIWNKQQFPLKRKSKSKWLAYFMAMRARIFDDWTKQQMKLYPNAVILHIGCGLDSRVERINAQMHQWFDIDFESVIKERKKYYFEDEYYHMIVGDVANSQFTNLLPNATHVIVILEGISMYLTNQDVYQLFKFLDHKYTSVSILMDVYTPLGAKLSKYKNPINDVGVTKVYGINQPNDILNQTNISFITEHDMTPMYLIDELSGYDKHFFRGMFAGSISKKMYKMYEFKKEICI